MIPILIASNTPFAGRTFIALGLAMKLKKQGRTVGYLKPLGGTPVKKGAGVYDADALFMKETLELEEPIETISPFVRSFENQTLLFEGKLEDAKARALASLKSLQNKEFVLIGGAENLLDGSLLDMNALSLAQEMNASVLLVERWRGDTSADSLFGAAQLFGKRFIGGVINKVPLNTLAHVKETIVPFLEKKGVNVFGVFQKDSALESISVRQLSEILGGKVICCNDRLDEYVENFSIGAMDVDSALSYFRRIPNKAVITGAHRSDIQLAAMETSTRCIILTGGLPANDVVVGKAQATGVPLISVSDDTFTTIDKIEANMGKTSIREKRKVARVSEMMDIGFDINRFLKSIS
jgi:hypothetical protein